MTRRNKLKSAEKLWQTFNAKPRPKKYIYPGTRVRSWPTAWGYSGHPATVYYTSDKWEPDGNFNPYYHPHGKKIGCWEPWGSQPWLTRNPPLPINVDSFPETATVLAPSLGWDLERVGDGKLLHAEPEGGELLCAFPDGKTLFCWCPRRGVIALFSGPGLRVEARGIVG